MANASWNLLIYANDDDVVLASEMRRAIEDMRNTPLPADCRIVVQFNTAARKELHWISNGHYEMEPGTRVDTNTAAALKGFLKTATDRLGRRPTMLVMAAHGSGLDEIEHYVERIQAGGPPLPLPALMFLFRSTLRWGPDPYNGGFLTNDAIRKAIAESTLHRVEVLAFNACCMGMLEIGFEMRDVADTFVSSQVLAKLWPYGDIVARLAADTSQSPERWAGAIVDAVKADIAAGRRKDAVSAFRTGHHLTDLADAVGAYAERAMVLIDTKWAAMSDAINNSPRGSNAPLAGDLALLVNAATCGDAVAEQAAQAVVTALKAARIANASHSSHPGVEGLNIFCPTDVTIDLHLAYANLAFRTNRWAVFLRKFQIQQAAALGVGHHLLHPPHLPH